MTTAPIHSVKHVKATYHRYQIFALISAVATIVAVVLAALFSYQLSRTSKTVQRSATSQLNAASQTLDNQVNSLNKKIKVLEERTAQDKETIKTLEAKTAELHKKLAEARKAAQAKTIAPPKEPDIESIFETPSSKQTEPTPDQTEQPAGQNETTENTPTPVPPVEQPASTEPASQNNPPQPADQQNGNTQ